MKSGKKVGRWESIFSFVYSTLIISLLLTGNYLLQVEYVLPVMVIDE